MTQLTALKELAEKVEAGAAPDYSLIRRGVVHDWDGVGDFVSRSYAWNAYIGSLDAAKALHEAVLPGWLVSIVPIPSRLTATYSQDTVWHNAVRVFKPHVSGETAKNTDPARAWLLAILRAKISELEAEA